MAKSSNHFVAHGRLQVRKHYPYSRARAAPMSVATRVANYSANSLGANARNAKEMQAIIKIQTTAPYKIVLLLID